MFFTTFNKKILFFTTTYTLLSFFSVNKAYAGVAKEYIDDPINSLSINDKLKNNIKKQIKNKQGFIRKYINPEENQIFGDQRHLLSFFAGDGSNQLDTDWLDTRRTDNHRESIYISSFSEPDPEAIRKYFTLNLNYSIPLKLFYINGRLTFGIFGTYINQNIVTLSHGYVAHGDLKTTTIGFEGVYEFILGHPNLYFTAGVGASYMFVLSAKYKTDNRYFDAQFNDDDQPKILWNNSLFNFVVKTSVGHRFDSGIIVEANWKHYSNGGTSEYNWGFNYLGLTIGVVF